MKNKRRCKHKGRTIISYVKLFNHSFARVMEKCVKCGAFTISYTKIGGKRIRPKYWNRPDVGRYRRVIVIP